MEWYYYIAWPVIAVQIIFTFFIYKNLRFALSKYQKSRTDYRPKTTIILPCKGRELDFEKNISSFFHQDYYPYNLWFVVQSKTDPAFEHLNRIKQKLINQSNANNIQILIAGPAQKNSQKVHNLLYACSLLTPETEVIAFADSDVCVRTDWLAHLVYPLKKVKNGASGGYRWFIPRKNNSATLAVSAINAKVAQLLGNNHFNQLWGGSMAVRTETFQELQLEKVWQNALSDDLSLSNVVKSSGKKVAFAPAALVASYEQTTWPSLFEFARRQFLITRISAPATWLFALLSTLFSVLSLWAGLILAIISARINSPHFELYLAVPFVTIVCQFARAAFRQKMAHKLLKPYAHQLKSAARADIALFWLWTIIMLAFIITSAFGRTIQWRGIKYKILGPNKTEIIR